MPAIIIPGALGRRRGHSARRRLVRPRPYGSLGECRERCFGLPLFNANAREALTERLGLLR
jgi:hypothetical protein